MRTRVRKALCGVAAAALVMAVTAACAAGTEKAPSTPSPVDTTTQQETPIGMPNPASVYCIEQGGKLETRSDADGNQSGLCIFPDGTKRNQWDFWRANHPEGDEPAVEPEGPVGLANPASVYCIERGGTLEMREAAAGTSGYCVFPDGTEKEEWEYWPVDEASVIDPDAPVGLANPASVYCLERGGELEMREEAAGTSGYCRFPDGTEKEEWEYWRENHPSQAAAGSIADYASPTEAPSGTPQIVRQVSAEESEEIARRFVLNSATYRFDGIDGSLELVSTIVASHPGRTVFTLVFTSANAGYGDRTGAVVEEVETPHKAEITLVGDRVTSAVLDGEWDMMAQEMVQ